MTSQQPPDDDGRELQGHEPATEDEAFGPSQKDIDRSWQDFETPDRGRTGGNGGIGSAVWKISVVVVSAIVLVSLTLGLAGPLLNRSTTPRVEQPERTPATVLRVIDGKTIVVRVDGGEQTVRLIGVETPPFGDIFYDFAREVSQSWIDDKDVLLEADSVDTDEQGRLLRYVFFDDVMINAALILNGLGTAETGPPNSRYDAFLADMERRAKVSGTGVWDSAYRDSAREVPANTEASRRPTLPQNSRPL